MKNIFLVFIVSILFICNSASADQCAYIDEKTKDAAYSILESINDYVDFCAPCQDGEPTEHKINKLNYEQVEYTKNGNKFYQIYINDNPIDIAYIYVNGRNLGILANCKPNGRDIHSVPEYVDDYLTGKWVLEIEE